MNTPVILTAKLLKGNRYFNGAKVEYVAITEWRLNELMVISCEFKPIKSNTITGIELQTIQLKKRGRRVYRKISKRRFAINHPVALSPMDNLYINLNLYDNTASV